MRLVATIERSKSLRILIISTVIHLPSIEAGSLLDLLLFHVENVQSTLVHAMKPPFAANPARPSYSKAAKDPLRRTQSGRIGVHKDSQRRVLGLSSKALKPNASAKQQLRKSVKKLQHATIHFLRTGNKLTYCGHDPMELVWAAIE